MKSSGEGVKRKHRMPEPRPAKPTWDEKNAFMDNVGKFASNNIPAIALGAAFSVGPDIAEGILRAAAEGLHGMVSNDSYVDFPDELTIEHGGPEERFGDI